MRSKVSIGLSEYHLSLNQWGISLKINNYSFKMRNFINTIFYNFHIRKEINILKNFRIIGIRNTLDKTKS